MSENLDLKKSIFRDLSAELNPTAILATNTSSISITKIAAETIPHGHSAASDQGQKSASRVVGKSYTILSHLSNTPKRLKTRILVFGIHISFRSMRRWKRITPCAQRLLNSGFIFFQTLVPSATDVYLYCALFQDFTSSTLYQ